MTRVSGVHAPMEVLAKLLVNIAKTICFSSMASKDGVTVFGRELLSYSFPQIETPPSLVVPSI